MKKKTSSIFARSPTLDTIKMIERTIEKHTGECTRRQLWKKLPKKVMWQTYVVALEYILSTLKVIPDKEGYLVYIWNPVLAKKLVNRPDLEWKYDSEV